jgi:hypothetical protein
MMALMNFLQQTTKIFLLIHSRHVTYFMQMKKKEPIKKRFSLSAAVETSPLLSCSSATPRDVDVAIQRACTLARNDLRHRIQRAKLRKKLLDATTYRGVCLLLQRLRRYPCQYLSKWQRFVLIVGRDELN